jgi:hypothetical protein
MFVGSRHEYNSMKGNIKLNFLQTGCKDVNEIEVVLSCLVVSFGVNTAE